MPKSVMTARGPTARRVPGAARPTRAVQITARSHEIESRHEAARRLLHDDQHLARVGRDFRRAHFTWQAHLGLRVVPDHCRVEVAKTVDLRRTKKPGTVDAPALQVVAEDLRQRNQASAVSASSPSPIDNGNTLGLVPAVPELIDEHQVS